MDLKTCRFCGFSNFEHHHPAAKSAWVKYGPRHSAHLMCIVAKKGTGFLTGMPTHKLNALPFMELQDLGILTAVTDELKRRGDLPVVAVRPAL